MQSDRETTKKHFIIMGRGDKKTAKGKRTMGSFGNSRKKKTTAVAKPSVKKAAKEEKEAVKKPAVKKVAAPKAPKVEAEKKPAAEKKTTTVKKTTKKSEE